MNERVRKRKNFPNIRSLTNTLSVENDFWFRNMVSLFNGVIGCLDISIHIFFTCFSLRSTITWIIITDNIALQSRSQDNEETCHLTWQQKKDGHEWNIIETMKSVFLLPRSTALPWLNRIWYFGLGVQLTYRHAIRLCRDVVTKYGSSFAISDCECCHSAFSEKTILYRIDVFASDEDLPLDSDESFWFVVPFDGVSISATCKEYVGSGGRKAKHTNVLVFDHCYCERK